MKAKLIYTAQSLIVMAVMFALLLLGGWIDSLN